MDLETCAKDDPQALQLQSHFHSMPLSYEHVCIIEGWSLDIVLL